MIIKPYWWNGTWVFDDPAVGLVREPFVSGIPEMINRMVGEIPDARKGFKLIFSRSEFPGYQAAFDLQRSEMGGGWYRQRGGENEGWLCPALFKYFEEIPGTIYARTEGM